MSASYVYFDLETSGTSDQEIIQIGATGARNDEPSFSTFLYPNGDINEYVTENIHGIEKVQNIVIFKNFDKVCRENES
jgi:DNA polymerase III epsilon subunit-like protein